MKRLATLVFLALLARSFAHAESHVIGASTYSAKISTGEIVVESSSASRPFSARLLLPAPAGVRDVHYRIKPMAGLRSAIEVSSGKKSCGVIDVEAIGVDALRVSVAFACGQGVDQRFLESGRVYGVWEDTGNNRLSINGVDHPLFALEPVLTSQAANARAPFFFSSKGYGVYVRSSENGSFAFSDDGARLSYPRRDLVFDVYLGTAPRDILRMYRLYAGSSRTPPAWALGTIWWRNEPLEQLRGVGTGAERVLKDIEEFQEKGMFISGYLIDRPYMTGPRGWGSFEFDKTHFPDPAALFREMHRRGVEPMVWIANRAAHRLYADGSSRKVLFPGTEADWPALDLRKPRAYSLFYRHLNHLARLGIRGFKIDRGDEEELPDGAAHEVSFRMSSVSSNALEAQWGGESFVMGRSVFDKARRHSAVWSGDPKCTWEGLRKSVTHGLKSGLIGFPAWGSDTGGYSGRPAPDLFVRWIQFSTFSPIMEIMMDRGEQVMPYDLPVEHLALVQRYTEIRRLLVPYLQRAFRQAQDAGVPVMRPLFLEYPRDGEVLEMSDAFLLGDDLLVAPITAPESRRKVYLPEGCWQMLDSRGQRGDGISGRRWISSEWEISEVPLFIRCGAPNPW